MREHLLKEGIEMPKMFYNFSYGTKDEIKAVKDMCSEKGDDLPDYFGDYIPPNNRITDVSTIIFKMIRPLITKAIFLKAIENIIIISLSVLIRFFVPKFKAYTARKRVPPVLTTKENWEFILNISIYPLIALVLSFFRFLI